METWKMIDPIPGDHIRVLTNGYYHHGIYIGNDDNNTVHYEVADRGQATILDNSIVNKKGYTI